MKARRVPDVEIKPDPRRVLFRPFFPGNDERAGRVFARVLMLDEEEVAAELAQVLREFGGRHKDLERFFERRFREVSGFAPNDHPLSRVQQLLIGAYFTSEYSLESAALFNPSMVPHPDQSGLGAGELRFMLSLRSTGEGHISSLQFRSGVLTAEGGIKLDAVTQFVATPETHLDRSFEKALFGRKLHELEDVPPSFINAVLDRLDDFFTFSELRREVEHVDRLGLLPARTSGEAADAVVSLAESNYEIRFDADSPACERIIFPATPNEVRGIEDARFVRFTEDDGRVTYYGTYTAYDGRVFFPQLLETPDFLHFKSNTLNGPEVKNKGLAVFPRKVNGLYAILSRQDNENNFIMFSENIHFWYEKELLLRPTHPWEFVQLGNCGSPIETEAGWVVLSHGVGPMRKYAIGAFLLDREDPRRVIGRLPEPLLTPDGNEREGYVPNVVYSCGGHLHGETLYIPYAMSDYASAFATVHMPDLLDALERHRV